MISNNQEIGSKISEKIKLLRECDVVKIVSYIESISVLNSMQPSVILLYCANQDSVGIVKEIRKLKNLDKVPIIFIMDVFVEDLLLYAFDSGIDDFFFLSDPDSIILTRIFLTIQKAVLYKQIETNNDVLIAANIIESSTGLYTKEKTAIVYRKFFEKFCEENIENCVFMYLKPVPIEQKKMSEVKTAKKIKSILRGNDIIGYAKNSGFYIILYNAGITGTQAVLQRIKNNLSAYYDIFATAVEITTDFDKLESCLQKSMKDQLLSGLDFSYVKDISYLDKENIIDEKLNLSEPKKTNPKKNNKDLRNEYFDSLDKIVAPVFYRLQTKASSELPDAEVKFDISETESIFSIKQNDIESNIVITFPAYIKLIVDIKHKEKNKKSSVKRLTFEVDEFSEEKLTSIISDVLQDFSSKVNIDKIYNPE